MSATMDFGEAACCLTTTNTTVKYIKEIKGLEGKLASGNYQISGTITSTLTDGTVTTKTYEIKLVITNTATSNYVVT